MSVDSVLLGTLNAAYQDELKKDMQKCRQGPISVHEQLYEDIRNETRLDVYSSTQMALVYLALKQMVSKCSMLS